MITLALFGWMVGNHTEAMAKGPKGKGEKGGRHKLDESLRSLLEDQGVTVPDSGLPAEPNEALVLLGQALFFDRELSGNRDISCATCHHPELAIGDALSLPIGTGAVVPGEIGPFREKGPDREFIPRNAPEVFNRGSILWFTQFWDSRIAEDGVGGFHNPAGDDLPDGLPNVLAVQAMFPVTSRDEMRGSLEDGNKLALIDENDPINHPHPEQDIWNALVDRLLAIDGYRALFSEAYGVPDSELESQIGFEHAATAIAAFEAEAFTFLDSPFDQYLEGRNEALSTSEKRGAVLFYGKANCSSCHSGPLMTDQSHYNLLVPHIGPGKELGNTIDRGRQAISGDPADAYRFRTPPLRNVADTGPYMHNGTFGDLNSAVKHHLDTVSGFFHYDPEKQIDQTELIATVVYEDVATSIPGDLLPLEKQLTKKEIDDLVKFLKALSAPRLQQRLRATIPDAVPSGLPIDGT